MPDVPAVRKRSKYERRWLRAGRCSVCGKPRAKNTSRSTRGSKRFCQKHLEKNREYQTSYRESLKIAIRRTTL
jgi:hypothetical protein